MAPEVNPQKISPHIKSTIRSYLSCSLATWKKALLPLFSYEIPWYLNPQSSKREYPPDTTVDWKGLTALSLPPLWRKGWLWHLLFSFTLTLRKWTHFHTFHLLRSAQYDFTTPVTSPTEASANGYHTREVWRASIHSHKSLRAVKFRNTLESLLWSLVIFADAVMPACFLRLLLLPRGNTCSNSRRESCKAYLSSSAVAAARVCLHDTFQVSNDKKKRKKKMEKRRAVFKQWQKEVCDASPCRWERGDEEC